MYTVDGRQLSVECVGLIIKCAKLSAECGDGLYVVAAGAAVNRKQMGMSGPAST